MPKPNLKPKFAKLVGEITDTLIESHKRWRPDLPYPQSHSDMDGAVRGLLQMFEVKRRAIPLEMRELLLYEKTVSEQRTVRFEFDDNSLVSLDEAFPFGYQEITVRDPDTDETRTLLIAKEPDYARDQD